MLVLEANNIKKAYGERRLFEIKELKIYHGDRIGIVGLNGSGKTTLLNVLSGIDRDYEGLVQLHGEVSHITQLGDFSTPGCDITELAKKLGVDGVATETMSGGEKTRLKIAQALSNDSHILFADEPTCNLDVKGILQLEEQLKAFAGALVVISHDRSLLNQLCTKIIEIEGGKTREFVGNYNDYKGQKDAAMTRQLEEYEDYAREKRRLREAMFSRKQKATSMNRPPSRMGNSEARLHKLKARTQKAKIERAAKTIKTRMDQLEIKEKPKSSPKVKIDIPEEQRLYSDIVISVKDVNKSFGSRSLLKDVSIDIANGSKTALVGDNGTGKTTLINMILHREKGIYVAPAAKIGYLSQDLDDLDEQKTVLENVLQDSVHPLSDVRLILARLLFRGDDVHKKVSMLSGGERVKASFAKIFLSEINVILLDEPTNYLDIYSQEALEEVLKEYSGTLFFVSHDRRFVDEIADSLIVLEGGNATRFHGTYTEYLARGFPKAPEDNELQILELEHRLAEVLGRLSMPTKKDDIAALDEEYQHLLDKLKILTTSL